MHCRRQQNGPGGADTEAVVDGELRSAWTRGRKKQIMIQEEKDET